MNSVILEALENLKYLTEDIAAVRRNYPKIPDDVFDRLIRLDPTFNENRDSVGTYGKWILNLYNKGKLSNEGHINDLLTRFEENKKYLKNKDINSFKSIEEVDAYLNNEDNYKEKTHRQEVRDNQKARKSADTDKDLVATIGKWNIYVPSSYENSCKLGQGASWCTATTETDYYYKYYQNTYGGEYYILINKTNPEDKYQFHFESNQFMDSNDEQIDIPWFFSKNPELKEFFTPKVLESVGMPKDANLEDSFEVKIDTGDFESILEKCQCCEGRNSLSASGIISILTDPFELFYNNSTYFPGVHEALSYAPPFTSSIRQELTRLGVLESEDQKNPEDALEEYIDEGEEYADEVEEAVRYAYTDAQDSGAANEAYEDLIGAIKSVFADASWDGSNITVRATYKDVVDSFFSDDNDEEYVEFRDPKLTAVSRIFANEFDFNEPYYGWQGQDDEAFLYRLEDELYQIGK